MSQRLDTITPSYNSFVPDQVLTHTQLNEIINYFEDQNRMSRLRLSGSGIACGFEVSVVGDTLQLTQGTGITTDGDLLYNIQFDEDLDEYITNCGTIQFDRQIDYDDEKSLYFTNRIPGYANGQIIELVPSHKELAATITTTPFSLSGWTGPAGDISNYVLVIYLECYSLEDGACTSTSCENQGKEETQNLRYLLINKTDTQTIVDGNFFEETQYGPDSNYTDHKAYENFQDSLNKLQVKRLIFHNGTSILPATTGAQVRSYYYNAIYNGTILNDLKTGLDAMCSFLGLPSSITADLDTIFNFSAGTAPTDVQYRFDLFKDLVETFNEARDLIMHVDTYCCPTLEAFPKHLMAGCFTLTGDETGVDTEQYRHTFYEAPIIGHEKDNYNKLVSLMQRAIVLSSTYNFGVLPSTLKITPSNLQGELGEKSIFRSTIQLQMVLLNTGITKRQRAEFKIPTWVTTERVGIQMMPFKIH